MPSAADDRYFGGKRGSSGKAYAAMQKTYKDPKKAEQVYQALKNKRKKRSQTRTPGGIADRLSNAARARARR